jgi:hypothetical protein
MSRKCMDTALTVAWLVRLFHQQVDHVKSPEKRVAFEVASLFSELNAMLEHLSFRQWT